MSKSAVIIGCGPSGLMAAYGALLEEAEVTIVAPKIQRSKIHGAQYVHSQLQGLPEEIEPFQIRYRYIGTEEAYRWKIYNDRVPKYGTSWKTFKPFEMAWAMDEVYDFLWDLMSDAARWRELEANPSVCRFLVDDFDFVLNTAPLKFLDPEGVYEEEKVHTAPVNAMNVPTNEIWYLGTNEAPYRCSNIAGHPSTEWPLGARVPYRYRKRTTTVSKPLDCNGVNLPGVHRLGRYGKWRKGLLTHHAYEEAREIVRDNLPWTASLRVSP